MTESDWGVDPGMPENAHWRGWFRKNGARVCPQHPNGSDLCHYPNAKMLVVQQAHPADEGMTWQAIRDVLLAGVAATAVLYVLFVWWLSLAVPR